MIKALPTGLSFSIRDRQAGRDPTDFWNELALLFHGSVNSQNGETVFFVERSAGHVEPFAVDYFAARAMPFAAFAMRLATARGCDTYTA